MPVSFSAAPRCVCVASVSIRRHSRILAIALLLAGCAPDPGVPETPGDWALYGRDYGNQRYSPLTGIHRENVGRLQLAWRFRTGIRATFQTNPLITGGVMYITAPYNDVIALDAARGDVLWRYQHTLRHEHFCCGPANRGAAVAGDKVFVATVDARLIALNRQTGAVIWDVPIIDPQASVPESLEALTGIDGFEGMEATGHSGYTANMAPQVYNGLVYVGISGAGYGLHLEEDTGGRARLTVGGFGGGGHGLRGFIVAYDAESGAEVWRWYPVPEQGWEGDWVEETAYGVPLDRDIAAEQAAFVQHAGSWRYGGGSIFTTPAIDTERGLLYLGTGNPSPQIDDSTRPGDNLYTVSLVALDARTGELVWHYQQVPHDRWGYDVASPPVLIEVRRHLGTLPAVAQASKLGWLFVHHRTTGELLYRSEPFAPQENLFARPTPDGVRIAPGTLGAVSWSPVAVDPVQRLLFVPGMHQVARFYTRRLETGPGRPARSFSFFTQADEPDWGLLTAIDIDTGEIHWQQKRPDPLVGGVLATAGHLLFTGEGNGHFSAFDSETGELLWQYRARAGVNAPPVTYAVNGRQYVAVAAGGNSLFGYPTGDELLVFALPD